MFESRVETHSFCGIETLNGYVYSASELTRCQRTPGLGRHNLDLLIHDTCRIHIKLDHKQGMCLIVMELLIYGDPLSKQWWPHHRMIQSL